MSKFDNGARYARDSILAVIVGLQNEISGDENYPIYAAYQRLYELITNRFGDMFEDFIG